MIRDVSRIAVLVSGEGTNLQALIDAIERDHIRGRINIVISNRSVARGLDRARTAGIEAQHVRVRPTRFTDYDLDLRLALLEREPDLIVLAGYMRLLSPEFTATFAGRTLNLHPSLLPRHKGLNTHQRALDAGDAHHGATVHFVTPDLDAGPRIVQYRIKVHGDDTEATLSARIHVGEHIILPLAARWFCAGDLRLDGEQVILDGNALNRPVVIEEKP